MSLQNVQMTSDSLEQNSHLHSSPRNAAIVPTRLAVNRMADSYVLEAALEGIASSALLLLRPSQP
jgi:hypothetical protein